MDTTDLVVILGAAALIWWINHKKDTTPVATGSNTIATGNPSSPIDLSGYVGGTY